jgi:hypothetical protein
MSKVSILYVTFGRDLEWTRYSLMSFRKFCKGFHEVVIVVPTPDLQLFKPFEGEFGTKDCPVTVLGFLEMPGKGFVHHLAMKCYADVFCPDADFILHVDPDCLWAEPATPEDYFIDGKPVLVIEEYDLLKDYHPGRYNWKAVTEKALGFPVKYETMCRHPAVHYRSLYLDMRLSMETVHRAPFLDYVLQQQNRFPQGFAEFPALGAFAVKVWADDYHLHDCTPERRARFKEVYDKPELRIGHPPEKLVQMWSYTGVDGHENRERIRKIFEQR